MATKDGRVIVKHSDKMWSTGRENAKHSSILALRKNPMNSMKNEDEPSGQVSNMLLGKSRGLAPERTERVTVRKARGLQMEEIGCKCQEFFIPLKWQEETSYKC